MLAGVCQQSVSEFVVHDFYQVCNLLVLGCLDEPLAEITLYRNVEHLFLFAGQSGCLNFLLHFNEFGMAQLHHLSKFLRAQEKGCLPKLLRQGHFHEFEGRNQA